MKEILYIQAGSRPNYIGSHFWNTQETYLSFEDTNIHHAVSFTESIDSSTGLPTYCPRAILFDRKSNFGSLAKNNALGNRDIHPTEPDAFWTGAVREYRQAAISKSKYHVKLEEAGSGVADTTDEDTSQLIQNSQDMRYWSDFGRAFYVPKSIQALPDPMYGERAHGDWGGGHELFHRYNEDTSLMDESIRSFLEECDFFQGLHILSESETFGGFTDALLTTFRDEFSKATSLVLPILSGALYDPLNVPDVNMTVVNDALYLRSLSEECSMVIPIQNPSMWPSDSWDHLVNFDKDNLYQTSAVISTHIETSTLPLRLNRSRQDLANFCAQSRRYGVGAFCQLSGFVPANASMAFDCQRFSFSDKDPLSIGQEWSRIDVSRGFTPTLLSRYDEWLSDCVLKGTTVSTTHALAYPLPSSYPAIFRQSDFLDSPYGKENHAPLAVSAFSSVSTGNGTAKMFSTYAQFIQSTQRQGIVYSSVGLEADELRELINDLWTLHDGYEGGA